MKSPFCNAFFSSLVLASWLGVGAAAAQESAKAVQSAESDPKTTTRVTLGSTSGTPGTPVVVPIYLTPASGQEVGRIKLTVDFVSTNLKFAKVERGIAAELGNVDVSADLKTGKNEKGIETSTLTILASFLSSPPPATGIPAGLLGYLTLKIEEDGRPAEITLRSSAEATELKTDTPLQNLRTSDAKVEVLAPGTLPLVVCFFFTH